MVTARPAGAAPTSSGAGVAVMRVIGTTARPATAALTSWGAAVAVMFLGITLAPGSVFAIEEPLPASRARLSPSRDPVLDDLLDASAPARRLALPADERRRLASMEELEDTRLERCRSTDAFEFDQCFFFGSAKAVDARRPSEGMGTLGTRSAGLLPAIDPRPKIPTW